MLAGAALLLAAPVLALSACGGDEEVPASEETASPTSATTSDSGTDDSPTSGSATSGSEASGSETSGGAAALAAGDDLPPRPERDRCVVVPEAEDGLYTVYEAGTAVVTLDGAALVPGDVVPADGWTHRVTRQTSNEVEIEFRREAADVPELEVDIDDGRVEVEICADDD